MSLILDPPFLDYPHPSLLLPLINLIEADCLIPDLVLGVPHSLQYLLLSKEFLSLLQIDTEYHAIDHSHLSEEPQSVLPHVGRLVVQAPDNTLEKSQVMQSRDDIGLSELDEHLADLGSAIGTLVMETLVQKF